MQLKFISMLVEDQAGALQFYTEILGFQKVSDIPMGPFRWLTVSSPAGVEGAELVLEPMAFEPAAHLPKGPLRGRHSGHGLHDQGYHLGLHTAQKPGCPIPRRAPEHGTDHRGPL